MSKESTSRGKEEQSLPKSLGRRSPTGGGQMPHCQGKEGHTRCRSLEKMKTRGARRLPRTGNPWAGRSLLAWPLLLLLHFAVSGMPGGLDSVGPHRLFCCKASCIARLVVCKWKAGNASKANYTLNLRYEKPMMQKTFQAGDATSFSFYESTVYALYNVTIWVENHAEDSVLISENLTLQISEAVKLEAPAGKNIRSFKMNGTLTLKWPKPDGDCSPIKTEARMRHPEDAEWTLGNCDSKEEEDGTRELVVLCHVEKNIRHEVQIRSRTSHWSSLWSDWSESITVPAEIHESPKPTYTVGQLGSDGLRNVTLEWEKSSKEQGEVTYALTFVLLPCNCVDKVKKVECFSNSCQVSLSGAGYNISLEASNQAGPAPPYAFHLPPAERDPGLPFRHSRLSSQRLSVEWLVKTDIEAYCFEEQPLDEALQEKPCTEEALDMNSTKIDSGRLEPNRCYRLAVHALDSETRVWSTLAFTHLFSRNTSLEDPIQVWVTNETTDSAVLWWEPPKALSACPNALKKYIICCRKEWARNVTYYEANVSETHYTILGLQPKTAYRVGVWASTDEEESACQPLRSFLTHPPGPKQVTLALSFWYLGIFGGLLTAISIFCFGKKRAKKALCSALPDPANTEAVKVTAFTAAAQVRAKQGFIEPLESSSPAEPFLVERPSKEEPPANAEGDSLGGARTVEEFPPSKEDPGGPATVLPLEYNSQGLLPPVEDGDQGQGWGDFPGVSSEARAGCLLLSPSEAKAGDSTAALPLTLLDSVVVTGHSAGGCGSSASA